MKYLFGLILVLNFSASAQVNPGSRFTALAGAGVALGDAWSMQQNQAGLAAVKNITVSIAVEKPFAGFDLSTQSLIFVVPIKNNVLGISFQRYGLSSYAEQRTAICYAKNFGNKLYAALNFNYHSLKIENYGSTQTYSVEAGLMYRYNKNLTLGAHIANPGKGDFDDGTSIQIPFRIQLGASYIFSEKVLLCSSLERNLKAENDARFGIEYQIIDLLAFRGGISANPFKQYAGFGINYRDLVLDFATSSHPVLGYSPQIALSYEF